MKSVLSLLPLCVLLPATLCAAPPNILLLMADDLGYGDLGCFGHPRLQTPHLDQLATEGLRLTTFYAAHSTCSPSRAGMMTGRTPYRSGIFTYLPGRCTAYLQEEEFTLGELARAAGFETGFFGKWGLIGTRDFTDQPTPREHGFDEYLASQNNAIPSHHNPEMFFRNGTPAGTIEGYSAQIVVDETMRWLETRKDPSRPFCAVVWFHEPHLPLAQPDTFTALYQDLPAKQARYFGNISHLDAQVGRLLVFLEEQDFAANTLVLFTSDNGPKGKGPGSSGGLRGNKGQLFEGGIRVPGIFRWPGRIEAGTTQSELLGFVDLLPTFAALLEATPPIGMALDGQSFLPLLEGKPFTRDRPLTWFGKTSAALREGKWKLYARYTPPPGDGDWMTYFKERTPAAFVLYDLAADPTETRNVAAEHPEILNRLQDAFLVHAKEVQADMPVWSGRFMAPPVRANRQ